MLDSTRSSTNDQVTQDRRTAVLYTRVSSKDQARGGFSIPAQHKLLTDYARERGFYVAAEFSDVETAGRAGRAEFGAMIGHVRRHPALLCAGTFSTLEPGARRPWGFRERQADLLSLPRHGTPH